MFQRSFLAIILFWTLSCKNSTQPTLTLREQILHIIESKKATVGVSMIGSEGKDTLSIHGERHCPLQSVFKFHIAAAVLSEIDKGKLSPGQIVVV